MELANWDYGVHQMLLNGLGNDWKMFIRLAGVKEHEINASIANNVDVEEQKCRLLDKKLNNCTSFCWNHVKKILKLLEKDKLITKLENTLKSNGSGVEEEDGKCLEENNHESKTLMFFIITKHIASCWKSISRCLGLNTDRIKVIQETYHYPTECAYQVLLELDDKNDLQWDDIESALIESEEVSLSVLKKVKEDLRKYISSFQEKPMEKDEQCHDFLTEWNIVITSHVSFEDIKELGKQVDKHESLSETISRKRIPFFGGANSIKTLNTDQWKSECGDYMEKYYGNMDFFTFNYDPDKVPDSFKDFLEKNQPGFLIKDYSLYKHFELLEMLSSLQDHQVEDLQHIKMNHIGFEAKNKTIYFFKISNAKTVHDLKQDIDDCALYVRMFLLLHKNELEGIIACLMSFIIIPTEFEGLINDITDNFCNNCKQYIITMNQFLNFDKLLSKGIKAVIKKTTKENWKKLEKSFDLKNFKHRMGTIFGVMANQEGNLVPNLSNDISEQLDNVRIFLYPQQVSIANSHDKHVLLKGGHGSGKTIVGRILLKKICSDFPNDILYYINFAASAAFTEDMQAYVNHIGCNNNVVCCDRTRFQNNEHLSDIINEIKRENMPTSQIHLIFDEVSLDEFGEKDIISFCDALNQPPYQGAFCLIICQAMTKQRTLKENGVTHKSSFMDQTQRLIEQSSFKEKRLNECLRYTAKIDKLVEIARVMLESAVNKFSNTEIEKKEKRKKNPMSRKTYENPPKSNSKHKSELNSPTNEVPSETDIFDDTQIPLTQFENRVFDEDPRKSNSKQGPELNSATNEVPSVFNFDADIKKVNPTPVNIINNGKMIESQFHYVKDSKVLHNIEVTELPRLYFPFDKENSFSPFEYVYLTMLCFDHLFESRYIDSDEKIVVIHLEDQTPILLSKALKLYEVSKEGNIKNIEIKKCLDVQGAEYKNVIIFFSVAEYHMRHFLIEAITRCKCNLAFFVIKENWEFAKKEVLWNIIQIWIERIDNEEKYITAFHTDDLNYTDDDLTKFQALYENELDERSSESSHDKEVAAEKIAKSLKNLGIAKEDSDDEDETNDDENEIKMDDKKRDVLWNKLILALSNYIYPRDVEELLYIYIDDIPDEGRESIQSGDDFFKLLEQEELIAPTSLGDLKENLDMIGRKDLIKKIIDFENEYNMAPGPVQEDDPEQFRDFRPATPDPRSFCYDMCSSPHGHCIIFNNTFVQPVQSENLSLQNRRGTEHDVTRLKALFEGLDYKVSLYNDWSVDGLKNCLKEKVVQCDTHDSFIVFLLSHGDDKGIYGIDGEKIVYDDIFQLCSSVNAPLLKGKPKLFFVSVCKGNRRTRLKRMEDNSSNEAHNTTIDALDIPRSDPGDAKADMFCLVSTTPGIVQAEQNNGTWFVQTFCDIFEKHAKKLKMEDLRKKLMSALKRKHTVVEENNELQRDGSLKMILNVKLKTLTKYICFDPKEAADS